VLERFNKEIAVGGPVRITHPNAICYSTTTAEAAGLVLQCMLQGSAESVFVLDMGKPIKLLDLAYKAIEFSGLSPDQDIEIEFTGIRSCDDLEEGPGCQRGAMNPTDHPRIMQVPATYPSRESVTEILQELTAQLETAEPGALKQLLKRAVPEYQVELEEEVQEPSAVPQALCLTGASGG
jgi:FlaA1/EpsC-like NDP-sugar epimerase